MLVIAVVALLAVGAYVVYDLTKGSGSKSGINTEHDKIIKAADSSKKEGSSTGSESSSRSSNSNAKPNVKSHPATKGAITSNPGMMKGKGSGDDPNDDEEDNGDKRKKKLNDLSNSGGSTLDEDSEEESGLEDEEVEQGVYWVDSKREARNGETPLVGSARP